jgi:chromosome segregation ATPase
MEERIFTLEQQNRSLNQALTDLQAAQASREQRLETRIQAGENRLNNLDQAAKSLDSRLTALSVDLTGLGGQVADLETHARQTDETLAKLKENTGRFDTFLTGLRDLLLAVQGAPAAETVQPAATPTPKN